MITGVHHVSVIVSCEHSVDFYKKLGFIEIFRKERGYDTVVLLEGYGVQLELFVDSNHPQRAMFPENLGIRNISLKVDSIDNEKQRLKDVVFGKTYTDWFGIPCCSIRDYDGNLIQLHE